MFSRGLLCSYLSFLTSSIARCVRYTFNSTSARIVLRFPSLCEGDPSIIQAFHRKRIRFFLKFFACPSCFSPKAAIPRGLRFSLGPILHRGRADSNK